MNVLLIDEGTHKAPGALYREGYGNVKVTKKKLHLTKLHFMRIFNV